MKTILFLLVLISCGKTTDAEIAQAFIGDTGTNTSIHYEGECFYNGCSQFMYLEAREVKGDYYIYHDGIIVPIDADDAISIDKNGLTCNYLIRTR